MKELFHVIAFNLVNFMVSAGSFFPASAHDAMATLDSMH